MYTSITSYAVITYDSIVRRGEKKHNNFVCVFPRFDTPRPPHPPTHHHHTHSATPKQNTSCSSCVPVPVFFQFYLLAIAWAVGGISSKEGYRRERLGMDIADGVTDALQV